jgi:protein kinase-like protein
VPVVADRYETLERIGGGGMADVFRAHDRTLDRDVAVKVMRPAFASDPEFAERFHREAEALGAIDHPNIVRVLDYGASADGPFIVMELVTGGTLRELMRARGRVDQYAAARIAAAIADGLEAAHLRGVLHRDLKPDNVLMDGEGRPKIADFGIARLAAATAITRTGEVLGTPQYLAPEQMSGDVVDERSDVFALGVILYEMLTGTQPTGGTTPSEIVSRRLRVDPRPPSRLVALTPAMNALVLRALARDPAHRVRRAADMRAALLAIRPPAPRAPARARVVKLRPPSFAPLIALLVALAAAARGVALPTVPAPPRVRMPHLRLPSAAPAATALVSLAASMRDLIDRIDRAANLRLESAALALRSSVPTMPSRPRVPSLRLPSAAPLTAALAALAASVSGLARGVGSSVQARAAGVRAGLHTMKLPTAARRRSVAPLAAALALLAAFVGGSLVFAGARPVAVAPIPVTIATPNPATAVLASTSSPAVTATPAPTAEPTAEPTPAPTLAPTAAPQVAVTGDPAGTIVSFYQLVSGHDYASASGLWSDRMRAAYPPQTNIWGRFDSTKSIVTRSASVTSAGPGSAAVAVDLVETMSNGSVRRWIGTWYLVRAGSGWLLDQPGLRPA